MKVTDRRVGELGNRELANQGQASGKILSSNINDKLEFRVFSVVAVNSTR